MKYALVGILLVLSFAVRAQESDLDAVNPGPAVTPAPAALDADRDPAALKTYSGKRTYPGGGDEEDLQVQTHLPDAAVKTDSHSVQRDVYKTLYNQEMKEERQETVEE